MKDMKQFMARIKKRLINVVILIRNSAIDCLGLVIIFIAVLFFKMYLYIYNKEM